MSIGRRTIALLIALAVIGLPAGVLRAFCLGHSCDEPGAAGAGAPFCSLPAKIRTLVTAGFRTGRSPEVLGVARGDVGTATAAQGALWPSLAGTSATRVPLVFSGVGVVRGATVPADTSLDAVAPTVAEIIDFDRPFPNVRSGRPIPGIATGEVPRLVLEVVWKGIGSDELVADADAWPALARLRTAGAGTDDAETGSVPVDPAAVLTTIGTGGIPRQHGVTGTTLRNEPGRLVTAWSHAAPPHVIGTLADDLDEKLRGRPIIGLVATHAADRGTIGGDWYAENDEDHITVTEKASPSAQVRAVRAMLARGFGADEIPDLIVVTMRGAVRNMDAALEKVVGAAQEASKDSLATVITATGSTAPSAGGRPVRSSKLILAVERALGAQVIEGGVAGGLFTDQETLASTGITEDEVVDALLAVTGPTGRRMMADAFPATAVTFARYC